MTSIEVDRLSKRYGRAIAVEDANLRLHDGHWLAQLRAAEPVAVSIIRRFPHSPHLWIRIAPKLEQAPNSRVWNITTEFAKSLNRFHTNLPMGPIQQFC